MVSGAPILEAHHFSKSFGGRTVLDDVSLTVQKGEVHALVGQNGSGKSTFIKILAGYHGPDGGGSLRVGGRDVGVPVDPGGLSDIGLSIMHQDLGLIDDATILENMRIGQYETGMAWRIHWRRERQRVAEMLHGAGLDLAPGTRVGDLKQVERAMVAILRAIGRLQQFTDGVLVLDEPTAYLPRDGVDQLLKAIRTAAGRGFGILFVSHRLDEVTTIADRVSVLRDGKLVATKGTQGLDADVLIADILGFAQEELYPPNPGATGDVVLSAQGVVGRVVNQVSLELRRGEILGVTGLVGAGYDELPYLLFGARPPVAGHIEIGGDTYPLSGMSPQRALTAGMAFLPANRLRDGAASTATVAENVSLPTLRTDFVRGFLRRRHESSRVKRLLGEFRVVPPDPALPFATLSGGNQQKALLAKWFATLPHVMLLHEPTQGVDVGARRQIFHHLRQAADEGTSFLLASAEYEDLAHLCDRVFVLRGGVHVSTLEGRDLTEARIVEQCFRST